VLTAARAAGCQRAGRRPDHGCGRPGRPPVVITDRTSRRPGDGCRRWAFPVLDSSASASCANAMTINAVLTNPHSRAANLRMQRLVLRYGRRTIIEDLSLTLPAGRVTAIVGPNGCGKSTLLSGLARLHKPASGRIYLDDQPIDQFSARAFERQLALLPQQVRSEERRVWNGCT